MTKYNKIAFSLTFFKMEKLKHEDSFTGQPEKSSLQSSVLDVRAALTKISGSKLDKLFVVEVLEVTGSGSADPADLWL